MLFDIFLLRYFSITDVAPKSIPLCGNRGLVNPCKSTSLEAKNVICVNSLPYFRPVVLDFTLSPTERFGLFVMMPNESLNRTAQSLFSLIAWFDIPHAEKTKYDLDQTEPMGGCGGEMTFQSLLRSLQPIPILEVAIENSVKFEAVRMMGDNGVKEVLKVFPPLAFRHGRAALARTRGDRGCERQRPLTPALCPYQARHGAALGFDEPGKLLNCFQPRQLAGSQQECV